MRELVYIFKNSTQIKQKLIVGPFIGSENLLQLNRN